MPYYECYLFGHGARVPACTQIECGSDAAAIATCRSLLAERPRCQAFELWQFRRLVRREERPVPTVAAPHAAVSRRSPRLLN